MIALLGGRRRDDDDDIRTVRVRGVIAILHLSAHTVTTLAPKGPPFVTHYPTPLEALAAWRQLLDGHHFVRLTRLDRRKAGDALAPRRSRATTAVAYGKRYYTTADSNTTGDGND